MVSKRRRLWAFNPWSILLVLALIAIEHAPFLPLYVKQRLILKRIGRVKLFNPFCKDKNWKNIQSCIRDTHLFQYVDYVIHEGVSFFLFFFYSIINIFRYKLKEIQICSISFNFNDVPYLYIISKSYQWYKIGKCYNDNMLRS